MLATLLGLGASVLTTVSYVPQLMKAWRREGADDLSLRMLLILLAGLLLWVGYGAVKGDFVIVVANAISSTLLVAILVLKLRHQ